jgi:hypothetical protein
MMGGVDEKREKVKFKDLFSAKMIWGGFFKKGEW